MCWQILISIGKIVIVYEKKENTAIWLIWLIPGDNADQNGGWYPILGA